MLIKGKGLFPAKGHEWEFVTHVDHNESSLRGHNVETRVTTTSSPSSPFFFSSYPWIVHEPSRIRDEFLYPPPPLLLSPREMRFPRWAHCRRSKSQRILPSSWMHVLTCRVDPLIIRKYYFCIIDAAGPDVDIWGRVEERKREKIVFRSASSYPVIHP